MNASEMLGLAEGLREMFSEFEAGWFVGLATVCYLVIQVLRGKAGFEIPYVTAWIEKLPKEIKTTIIVSLFGISGSLLSLSSDPVTFFTLVDGFFAGVATGLGTIGARSVSKQAIEGVKKLRNSTKTNMEKK